MPRKSDSTTFDPPIQGWRVEGYSKRIASIQPVLIHKETAFKFKIQKYFKSYNPREPKFVLARTCTYYDKSEVFFTYEAAVRHIIAGREFTLKSTYQHIEYLNRELNKAKTALLTPEPFPDPSTPMFTPPKVEEAPVPA